MAKKVLTTIAVFILLGIVTIIYFRPVSETKKMGLIQTLTSPSSMLLWIPTTTTDVILSPSYTRIYAKFCTVATTTFALGGEIISYYIATSSDATSTDWMPAMPAAFGPYSSRAEGNKISGFLDINNPCIEFKAGENLTPRMIIGRATTTDNTTRSFYIIKVEQ